MQSNLFDLGELVALAGKKGKGGKAASSRQSSLFDQFMPAQPTVSSSPMTPVSADIPAYQPYPSVNLGPILQGLYDMPSGLDALRNRPGGMKKY